MPAGHGGTSTSRRRGGLWITRVLSIGATRLGGQPEPWSTPKERAMRGFLRQPGGLERLVVRVEPAEAHRLAVPDSPDVAVLAFDPYSAPGARGRVARQDDDVLPARVDEALDLDRPVLVGLAHHPEAPAPDPRARLDRVVGVHVIDVRGDEVARRLISI